jgi:hypothetical protein
MIHYHGTRFSGDIAASVRSLKAKHACVSFSDPGDVEIVAEICQSFMCDNGAYTTWKQGKKYDIKAYSKWIGRWCQHPSFDWFSIPDSIGGTLEDNQAMRAAWRSACPDAAKRMGVPVWHLHEPVEELAYLCLAYPRVAIGSSGKYSKIGTPEWWGRIAQAMEVACDEEGRPKVKLHGYRQLNSTIFSRIPYSSTDSTSVARNIGIDSAWRGTYTPKSREARALILMERIESHCSAARWCRESSGFNMELLG